MTQQEANELIAKKLEEIKKLVKECEDIADANQCYFNLDFGDCSYNSYSPKKTRVETKGGWNSSSQSC